VYSILSAMAIGFDLLIYDPPFSMIFEM